MQIGSGIVKMWAVKHNGPIFLTHPVCQSYSHCCIQRSAHNLLVVNKIEIIIMYYRIIMSVLKMSIFYY